MLPVKQEENIDFNGYIHSGGLEAWESIQMFPVKQLENTAFNGFIAF